MMVKNEKPWWVDVYKQAGAAGVLTLVILSYGFYIMVPESKARVKAMEDQVVIMKGLEESVRSTAKTSEKLQQLADQAAQDHKRAQDEHNQIMKSSEATLREVCKGVYAPPGVPTPAPTAPHN